MFTLSSLLTIIYIINVAIMSNFHYDNLHRFGLLYSLCNFSITQLNLIHLYIHIYTYV